MWESENVCVCVCIYSLCAFNIWAPSSHPHILLRHDRHSTGVLPSVSQSVTAQQQHVQRLSKMAVNWMSTCWSRAMWRYIHSVDALFSRVRLTKVRLKHNSGYFLRLPDAYGKCCFMNCSLEKMLCTHVYVLVHEIVKKALRGTHNHETRQWLSLSQVNHNSGLMQDWKQWIYIDYWMQLIGLHLHCSTKSVKNSDNYNFRNILLVFIFFSSTASKGTRLMYLTLKCAF